ncbi:DUF1501 domain-containing protein [Tautonia rosea]|uniref:DUF1501 domain-containing protein n=1 Tax=Tautonia rosea TaxID=2728037 RepID=UPI0014739BAC|nr:DUF1501 domain-containing protein [Tautonia rosea]
MITSPSTRRDFLRTSSVGLASASLAAASAPRLAAAASPPLRGSAKACIMLWLGGGAAHIDTFDPKRRGDGKKQPGSYYDAIPTAIPGASVCEHLSRVADRLDRCVLIRSLHHSVIDEHAAATNIMHTGRLTSGTVVYPSMGSVVSHQLGPGGDGVPSYLLVGHPSVSRGPGFLGATHSYVYLTDTESGPTGLTPPDNVSRSRQQRREALLDTARDEYHSRHPGDARIADYIAASREAARLAGPDFARVFQLDEELASIRDSYGGEFGQRCLLARRLVEAGSRFVEVSHNLNFINGTGWDTHNQGQLRQHELIGELDLALSGLLDDLERLGRLDSTLVIVATEFGRPPEFDSGGGRGHQSQAFSGLLAGGGLRTGQVIGETDELAKTIVDRPVSVPDLFATIYSALGINPALELHASGRPVPVTDHGRPISDLFSNPV